MSNDLALIRCQKQFLTGTPAASVLQIVEWFGALQAQDFGGALWAIGQRSGQLTAEHVHLAIAERQIVRTWPLRGTFHFVPAADLRWMLALTGKRQNERSWSVLRSMGLDLDILEYGRKVLEIALRDGALTRPVANFRRLHDCRLEPMNGPSAGALSRRSRHSPAVWRKSRPSLRSFRDLAILLSVR